MTNAVGAKRVPIRRQESILSRVKSLRNSSQDSSTASSSRSSSASTSSTSAQNTMYDADDEVSHSSRLLLRGVDDIDKNDEGKSNLESEYVKDIYAYLQQLEKKFVIPGNYLSVQKEVTPKMRTVLMDWLNEVHLQFHLFTETYYLTVGIIDRYLNAYSVTSRKNLQLVGVAAMFLACKYEEMYPPMLKDFVFITDDTYTAEQITQMEMHILKVRYKRETFSSPLLINFVHFFFSYRNWSLISVLQQSYTLLDAFLKLRIRLKWNTQCRNISLN